MDIVNRIADQLNSLFPNMPIYREQQSGGFKEPSFFIHRITSTVKPELFQRQNRSYHYQLVYFPQTDHPEADMEQMEENLLDRFLSLDEFATIRNREFEEVDGALTMTFMVNLRAYPEDLDTKMDNYDPTITHKEA